MATTPVEFAVADEDRPVLDELVARFGGGDHNVFLREAMRRMRHDLFAQRMRDLQADVRADLFGRVVDRDRVARTVRQVLDDG
ncbi:MAG: hypothetical protein FWH11_11175 [Micrococcales bacterium]|nr:hypothetical protein [Micrococcales bacterium]